MTISMQERTAPDFLDARKLTSMPTQYSENEPFNMNSPHIFSLEPSSIWDIYRSSGVIDQLQQLPLGAGVSSMTEIGSTSISDALSRRISDIAETIGGQSPELYDALCDLHETKDEARGEGFPVPTDAAFKNARSLLRTMYGLSPRRFEVYPTPDGDIAINAPGGYGRSVLLLCDSDGGALCSVNMNGVHRRARYSDTNLLPDGFVREALAELEQRDDLAA